MVQITSAHARVTRVVKELGVPSLELALDYLPT